ncbi:hypothetical protein EGW08_001886 [Elysia chlorotica]|uniref:REJ domain-containing protein n=1 Tax=Elysia chlorotica TaxID=188477 RepID=A0A433U9B3_ELYCH|nr:hypothetical protein EGW08_001886 [Elysia chlorotica]
MLSVCVSVSSTVAFVTLISSVSSKEDTSVVFSVCSTSWAFSTSREIVSSYVSNVSCVDSSSSTSVVSTVEVSTSSTVLETSSVSSSSTNTVSFGASTVTSLG